MKYTTNSPFKVQENKRFIQQLANNTPDILYVIDLEKMRIVFINERATDLLGSKDKFLEALNPCDSLARMKHFEECEYLDDNEIKEIDVRLKIKNGSWRWFRIRDIAFKRNINGVVYQIIGMARDIHEHKLAETTLDLAREKIKEEQKKLEGSRKLLQSVFDITPLAIQVYKAIRDSQNKITGFHLEAMDRFVESGNENLSKSGKSLLSALPLSQYEDFMCSLIRAVENDETGEKIIHYKDNGYDNWYAIKYKKFGDGVMVSSIDITEIKKTEKELKESNYFIEQITTTTTDIIYVFNLQERSIAFINEKATQILGYSAEQIYSQAVNIFPLIFHPDDFERRMEHLLACKELKENEIREIDIRLKVRSGHWHWFRIRDKVLKRDEAGNVLQTIGIGRDIHEQNLITLAIKNTKMQMEN